MAWRIWRLRRGPLASRARIATWIGLALVGHGCVGSRATSSVPGPPPADAAACRTLVPSAAGGPNPPASTLVLRWLGTANYELAYNDQVVLLDAYFDRGPRSRPIGMTAEEVRRADLILIGHAHWDHIADAAEVARRTHALVVGASSAIRVVQDAGLPIDQTRTVNGRGGEVLQFKGFTVEPVLAHHSILQPTVLAKFRETLAAVDSAPTAAAVSAEAAIHARGSDDPSVSTEGTLAYLITLDSGFRLIWLDSAGPITEEERALMARIGRTDVAIVAYQGQYLAKRQVATTLPHVKLFRPGLYLPAHHDELPGLFLDIGIEPLLTAIRDEIPETRAIATLYRAPICLSARAGWR
jgi:L-ascorbate metabolism protein UlaG (beta-lactamase superfamily)